MGSPSMSVNRESLLLGPTSHVLSTSSTLSLSLLTSNSLITILSNVSSLIFFLKRINGRKYYSNEGVLIYIYEDRRGAVWYKKCYERMGIGRRLKVGVKYHTRR
jgi:hypothetical protein